MSMTNFMEGEILKHIFGLMTYTPPSTLYLSLHTAEPAEDQSETYEVTADDYFRWDMTNDSSSWVLMNDEQGNTWVENLEAIEWEATSNWGVITHLGIWDADTGGNLLFIGELSQPVDLSSGGTLTIQTGQLKIYLD